jgi:serine/threonine-protein kinase
MTASVGFRHNVLISLREMKRISRSETSTPVDSPIRRTHLPSNDMATQEAAAETHTESNDGGPGQGPVATTITSWELLDRIGFGAWTQVHRARPAGVPSSRPAAHAVKTLRPDRQGDAVARGMLVREAEAAAEVSHPHLIAILESQFKREPWYLVMPWLEGASLQSYTAARRLLDPPAVLWIARQTAEALDALHRAGWMHGDVKPGNIFISPRGHVTLLDLGFAQRSAEPQEGPGPILGTGHYLSPEQVVSTYPPDIRSDIYSLGVVLYQLLSGGLPLQGRTLEDLAAQHKQTAPIPLRRVAPHVPACVADLVQRMLAKDPLRRPQSPAELVDELVRLEIRTFSERAA